MSDPVRGPNWPFPLKPPDPGPVPYFPAPTKPKYNPALPDAPL